MEEIMTGEENLEIVQRFLDKGELNAMAEDAVFQDFTQSEPIIGNKAISESIFRHYNIQFHEADAEMINIVTGKTSVVMEFIFRGVHKGELHGIPPTGKEVEIPMCVIYDVEGGIITKGRLYYDAATMLRQMGIDSVSRW
jgi:steroid delta-isomerase-like uncharacterized protein